MSRDEPIVSPEPAVPGAAAGYGSFDDFVQRHHYQYGLDLNRPPSREALNSYAGKLDEDRVRALYAARNVDALEDDSVAINQTINTAVVVMAEKNETNPAEGKLHYVAFMQSDANSRTYIFTENITINPDGTASSSMEEGKFWVMNDLEEQRAYERLSDKFGKSAGREGVAASSPFLAFARKNDVAVGGVQSEAGQFAVEKTQESASVSSAAEINRTTGIEVTSKYTRSGDGGMLLKVFRESAGGMGQAVQGIADAPDSKEKYDSFSKMRPGINALSP